MKKLMTVLATAATALFAASAVADGEFSESAENFEGLHAGAFDSENGLNGYWLTGASADEMTVSNHVGAVSCPRPDKWNGAANSNYLQLDVSTPLARGLEEVDGGAFPGVAIGDGIYLDTLVKFTAADDVFGDDALATGDKIAIEYVAQGDDVENPITNFVIRAGKTVEGSLVPANYLAAVPENFDVNAWHRLTVRSIEDVGDGQVGFVIYLDGNVNPLAYDTSVNAGFGTLDPVAQKFYNEGLHALFPSAVDANATGGTKISAAAFSGTGGIDDVVITRAVPGFIASGESVVVPFVADAGVTAISVTVAGVADPIPVVDGAATLPSGTTNFTVTATVDTDHGYTLGSISYKGSLLDNGEVTDYAGGNITITTVRNNFNLFDAEGVAISGTFQTLSEALAADDVARIALAWNYQVTAEEAESEKEIYSIDGNIVLDLNGKTLDGGEGNGFELFYVTGSLKVIDSVGGGKIVYGGNVFGSEGSLRVGDVSGDNGVTIDGVLLNAGAPGYIIRAKVLAEVNTDGEDAFLWNNYLGDGEDIESKATLVGDYWVVEPKGEEPGEDTVIAVPTAASNLVYDGTEQTGVEAGTGYTLTGDFKATNAGDYTATATLEEGYVWQGGSKEAQTINWSIAPKTDAAVVVTLTSEIAEYSAQLEFPTASATIGGDDVEGTPAWDPATISEPEAGATNTYTVTFTVTTANYAGSTGTATFKVYKAAGGAEYPSYIDDNIAYKDAYDTWKTDNNVAAGDNQYATAFLLNIAPDAVDQTLEPESITIENGKVVITANRDLGEVNGKVYIKTAGTLAGLADAQWAVATVDEDGAIEMTPNGTATAAFFKIKVDF